MSTLASIPLADSPDATTARRAWLIVCGLGLAHMIVDATTIYTAARLRDPSFTVYDEALWLGGAYNLLAFATQPLLGWLVDKAQAPAAAAALGSAMAVAGAILNPIEPMLALWLVGIGNSLFHVGGGSICLKLARGKAAMPGVFVAPGAIGVVLGILMADGRWPAAIPLVIACVLTCIFAAILHRRKLDTLPFSTTPSSGSHRPVLAIALVLLCFSISSRATVGGWISATWQGSIHIWIALAVAATLAKALGGIIADRIGWLVSAATWSLAAAPLLLLSGDTPSAAIAAVLLIQALMPITLAAIARIFPTRTAFAFGLASFCLTLGTTPAKLKWLGLGPTPMLIAQLACAAAVVAGIRTLTAVNPEGNRV